MAAANHEPASVTELAPYIKCRADVAAVHRLLEGLAAGSEPVQNFFERIVTAVEPEGDTNA